MSLAFLINPTPISSKRDADVMTWTRLTSKHSRVSDTCPIPHTRHRQAGSWQVSALTSIARRRCHTRTIGQRSTPSLIPELQISALTDMHAFISVQRATGTITLSIFVGRRGPDRTTSPSCPSDRTSEGAAATLHLRLSRPVDRNPRFSLGSGWWLHHVTCRMPSFRSSLGRSIHVDIILPRLLSTGQRTCV